MIKTYFYFLHLFYRALYKIEKYLTLKSLGEKIILFLLLILSVFVPLYFYLIPFLKSQTNYYQHIAHNQRVFHESTQAQAKALQQSQEQNDMLEEINLHLQTAYMPLNQFEIIWQDIITHISTAMLQADIQNIKISIEDDQLFLSGITSLPHLIKALNILERNIPLLKIKHLILAPDTINKQDFSYSMQMQKITQNHPSNIDTKELLLTYLNTPPSSLQIPELLPDLPPNSTLSHPIPQVNLKLQAIFNDQIKINGQWISIHDSIEGFKLIEIKTCGALLQSSDTEICLPLPNPIPQTNIFQ